MDRFKGGRQGSEKEGGSRTIGTNISYGRYLPVRESMEYLWGQGQRDAPYMARSEGHRGGVPLDRRNFRVEGPVLRGDFLQ